MPPNQPGPDQTRNLILAMILMMGFLFAYQTFVIAPQEEARRQAQQEAAQQQQEAGATGTVDDPAAPVIAASVEEALSGDQRIAFDGPGVDGSINLTGARLDDLKLRRHFVTVEDEEELRLLRPENSANGYYATYGWLPEQGRPVIGVNTEWRQQGSGSLSPGNPVTLVAQRGGLSFERTIALDDNYMFTFTDRIVNNTGEARSLTPFGVVRRYGAFKEFLDTTDPGASGLSAIVHLGLIGVLDRDLKLRKYKPLSQDKGIKGDTTAESAGWMGFTDKYWMTALIPRQGEGFETEFNLRERGDEPLYELLTQGSAISVPAGGEAQIKHRVFAGAKRLEVLRGYEEDLGLPRFTDAIDWGMFWFLTKPFFQILLWLEGIIGSFGWAILAFTVLVKIPLIPLYNQSYKSMAKMKLLAEPMKEIQEKYKDDPQQRQQEVMKLYQREKANPIAGCVPILATIPIFYALYKTLFVTLEMRHEPFGYLKDLSAPDPTAIGNLFGLLPWAAADMKAIPILGIVIGIGVLPILYGVTMAALQSLSPPPPDPTQRMIMMALPVILTFVFGGFAAGLVLYWVWNNLLSLMQQYFIMRRNGVETQLDKLIAWLRGKRGKTPAE